MARDHDPAGPPSPGEALAALDDLAEAAGTALSLGAFLPVACERVANALGATTVAFFSFDGARPEPTLRELFGDPGVDRGRLARFPGALLLPESGARDQVILVEDLSGVPAEVLAGGRLRTLVTVPVLFQSMPEGALLVGYEERKPRAGCPLQLLRSIAVHFAAAIDKFRILDDLRGRVEELSLLNEIGRAVASSLDLERTLDHAVWALNQLVTTSTCYVLLLEGDHLRFVASTPSTRMLIGTRVPVSGNTVVAHAVRERRAIAVDDARNSPIVDQALAASYDARSLLAAPLLVRDQPVGAVVAAQRWNRRRFTSTEVDRMMTIANHLAVAIDNARLYEDLRASYAELARAQDQLVHRERLAALGELAAVIAHEVRNPLGVMFNSLGALRRLVQPADEAGMLLDMVGEEADRLNRMVRELLEFAKPSAPNFQPEPLDRLLDEAVVAAMVHAANVEVHREYATDLSPVPVDAQLLRQGFLNLVVNAIQAMPDGGDLTVSIQRVGESALVEIRDTGTGIPERAHARLFQPFFTTKATGTGLGLALVKRIVDDHAGSIEVRSGKPHGTVFAVRLPLARPAAGPRVIHGRADGGRSS